MQLLLGPNSPRTSLQSCGQWSRRGQWNIQ